MFEQFVQLITYITVLSVAAERVTDMVKRGLFQKFKIGDLNGVAYQVISGLFAAFIVYLDDPVIELVTLDRWLTIVLMGLAASGGSGAWNSILSILKDYSVTKSPLVDSKSDSPK